MEFQYFVVWNCQMTEFVGQPAHSHIVLIFIHPDMCMKHSIHNILVHAHCLYMRSQGKMMDLFCFSRGSPWAGHRINSFAHQSMKLQPLQTPGGISGPSTLQALHTDEHVLVTTDNRTAVAKYISSPGRVSFLLKLLKNLWSWDWLSTLWGPFTMLIYKPFITLYKGRLNVQWYKDILWSTADVQCYVPV